MEKEKEVAQEGEFKIKKKRGRPRKLNQQEETTLKVNLNKKEEKDAVQEPSTEKVMLQSDGESQEKEASSEVGLQEVGTTHEKEKPAEEIDFIMEDKFLFDEDYDDEKQIRKKKLAYKEEVAKAKNFLEDLKSKYYDEIKLRPGVTQEQKKAMDFFDRYKQEQEVSKKQHESFKTTTKKYFSEEFKGFDFNLGEKKFRYGVSNPSQVADVQSDLSNFVGKFLNEDGSVNDHQGYHKALYAARNADTIAKHFYEQGIADATKDIAAKSKNISNEPRATSSGDVFINGFKVKAISGVDSSKLKIKKR
jgi:hypothetical protein